MANKLIFKNAEAVKNAIMDSQKKEIAALYEKWADEIEDKANYYAMKTNASAPLSERYYKELKKQMTATSQAISNEIYGKIKKNIYTISDSVVADNVKWLESFGFDKDGLNAAFSYVPDEVVRNLITGQIYDSGWSLSEKIWGDNEQTLKDIYQVMAKGMAEQKPIYQIAKDLETYVRPTAKLPWNLTAQDGVRIYKKQVDYNAQRLARTLVQHGYQQSFVAVTEKNPFITEYIWRSNGSRVCQLCLARDGAHFKKDELPLDHPNGMCTIEPVVAEDMVDQLADWFNSPDGTFPSIDEFAGNFGYEATNIGTAKDFVAKYGTSDKKLNAWKKSLTPIQKAEAQLLKEQSGLTWQEWYKQNVFVGDESKLIKKSKKVVEAVDDKFDDSLDALLDQVGFSKQTGPGNFDTFDDWFWGDGVSVYDLEKLSKLLGNEGFNQDALEEFFAKYKAQQAMKATKAAAKVVDEVDNKVDEALEKAVIKAQAKLDAIPNKTYSGIWIEDVTLADYEAKASAIKKKKQYYKDQIDQLSYHINKGGTHLQWKLDKFVKNLEDLEEFGKLGKKYAKAQKELKSAKLALNKAKAPTGAAKFSPAEYTDEAKSLAKSFTSRTAADNFHRPYLDSIWDDGSDWEKYSVWEYTQNSNPINKSLSGYHDSWNRSSFLGLGNTKLGYEDNWRHFSTAKFRNKFGVDGHKDYKSVVQNLTTMIDKSEMPESVYVVRGSDKNGFAGILEGDLFSFEDAISLLNSRDKQAIKDALEGQTFMNHAYTSTGIAKGTGFGGEVKYEIYLPKGTKAIYAEPASYYGNTIGGEEIYKVGQSYSGIGGEAEVIIQRGTSFRITEVEVDSYGELTVKMEVVNQPDYFKTGLEHTHNSGKTSYKK